MIQGGTEHAPYGPECKNRHENVFRALKPLLTTDWREILNTTESYLEREGNAILIDWLSIQRNKISFLMMIRGREDGIVIGLCPILEIEKTEGVKRRIAETAKQLVQAFPELKTGERNVSEYLR
jgi:hypothetical protein